MPDIARRPRFLTALGLALPLLAAAQTAAPPPNVPERALRDAERVLSIIKFHAVRPRAAEKPRRPAPAATPRPTQTAAVAAPTAVAAAASAPPPTPAAEPPAASVATAAMSEPPTVPPPAAATTALATPSAGEDDADADEPDEVALQLRHFVAPVLTPSVQAMLGTGARRVAVRFTVDTDGTVTKAQAAADVPPRLARPATEAVLQWQFEPLPQPRTVDVELALRRE